MRNHSENGWGRQTPYKDGWKQHLHHDEDRPHRGRRRGGRMLDYGELRLLILSILAERPSHGYELIKSVEERFGGSYAPSPGVLYPTLAWLDDVGYAVVQAGEGNRKSYSITSDGEAYLAANRVAVERLRSRCGPNREGGAPAVVALAMDDLKMALRSRLKGQPASQTDVEQIAAIVRDAAQKIENMKQTPSEQAGHRQNESRTMNEQSTQDIRDENGQPRIELVRHELRRRQLTVVAVERLTPVMIRITLGGEELEGFTSLSAGDHIKIFVPDGAGGTAMRDYTPRHYDPVQRRLVIDFAVHEAGPATQWALGVRPGDMAHIGGPRGSQVITGPIRSWLLIGDETALPSIGRRVEETAAGVAVTTLVAVPGVEDEQRFETQAELTSHWIHRADAVDPAVIIDRLREMPIDAETFVWVAAEGAVTKAVRAYLLEERKHPRAWLRAAGYWVKGKADATEKFED